MIRKADAIVIGSGGLGAATAYYLSERKKLSVVLIDKHDIGPQTSPRAAGMVTCARKKRTDDQPHRGRNRSCRVSSSPQDRADQTAP